MRSTDRVWRERGLRNAVLAGDEKAWEAWYKESFDDLYRFVSWRCGGDRDLAADVVQETWLTAVRRIRDFDPERGSFAGWLRGIAVKGLRNHLRKRERQRPRQEVMQRVPAASPNAAVESRERAEHVARALSDLNERYEAVLRAKYLEQKSVADIAEAWNETPKSIESLLTRARAAFREAYLRLE